MAGSLAFSSCASITPVTHERQTPSFDGNTANSGIISIGADGSLEITSYKREEYNSLVEAYGKGLHPPLQKDFGITPLENGNFQMTDQAAEKLRVLYLMEAQDDLKKKVGTP